jgi:NAD(P)H-hydrate repair Nnr-like enzyme with NAD(P)H-hydrate dehydratase domain
MAGAAALCAEGALRGGAGLVHVLTPEPVFPVVAGLIPKLWSTPAQLIPQEPSLPKRQRWPCAWPKTWTWW